MVTCADCIPNNVERVVLLCSKHRATDELILALEPFIAFFSAFVRRGGGASNIRGTQGIALEDIQRAQAIMAEVRPQEART